MDNYEEALGIAHEEIARLRDALRRTRELWGRIFKQYKSEQHVICNTAAEIIDEAIKEK